MPWVLLVVGGLLVLGALAYWQLIVAEGTYLGPRIVVFLYDLAASAYERIKQFDPGAEQWFLGLPLAKALDVIPAPLVLDVGTGTGRLPRALLFQPRFRGRVVGLDLDRDDPVAALRAQFNGGLEGVGEKEVRKRLAEVERAIDTLAKGGKIYGHLQDDVVALKYLHQRYSNYLQWLLLDG